MSSFDDILAQPLPSKMNFFEGADEDEKKDETEDKEVDRQSIVDAIGKVVDDLDDVEVDTDDFLSGDEDEIDFGDLDKDVVADIYKKLKDTLKEYKEIEIKKDDDEIKVSLKKESALDILDLDSFFESEEDDVSEEEGEEDDMSEEADDDSSIQEFGEDDTNECGETECGETECGETECGTEDDELEDDFGDDDDEEDEEIDTALDDLEDETDEDIADGLMNADSPEEDDDTEEELTPAEDQKADDMLAMVATPMLIKDELTAEESVNFYESVDSDIAVSEGLIMESDLDDIFTEGVFASPNKPFKMTKKARFKQLYELSVQIEARAHRDPKMKQLDRAYKIERKIKKELRQKYGVAAKKRATIYLKRLMKSKSGVLKNLGKKMLPKK